MIERIWLGLPIWNRADWNGELYPPKTPADRRLEAYARWFNAVEGNTTFYATPPAKTVLSWLEQTPPGFRFCFKLPRTVTHDRMLVNAEREAVSFMEVMRPLADRLGPVLVQLPPRFGPDRLPQLEDFLLALPPLATYAVEVRHPAYFEGALAEELDSMLAELGVDRVILDTLGVHEATGDDPALVQAHERKPKLPAPVVATAGRPVLRFIANPDLEANDARLSSWSDVVVRWLEDGREPHVFMHVPNDFHAPRLARRFFDILSARIKVGHLPGFVGERRKPEQVALF